MNIKQLQERAIQTGFSMELYLKGLSLMAQSGLFALLREQGRPASAAPDVPHYLEYQHALTNFSIGYNEALDHIMNFRELIIDSQIPVARPAPDFGALDAAVLKGNLTKEEADVLRSEPASWNAGLK